MCASPQVRDTTLALQLLCRPCRHLARGSGRFGGVIAEAGQIHQVGIDLSSQNCYPHTSLDLLQRPPHAYESSCMMLRLPPWRDVAAEHLA